MAQKGKKTLHVDIPVDLFNMYTKLCVDLEITKTEGLIRYFKYLQKQYYKRRRAINEKSEPDFKLHEREPE
jgi:hypothetical protein